MGGRNLNFEHASETTPRKEFMCLSNLKVTFILITLNMNMNYATTLRKD